MLIAAHALVTAPASALPLGGALGVGYLQPASSEISRPYGGGIAPQAEAEVTLPGSGLRVGVIAGVRWSSATFDHPTFVDSAEGKLRTIPIDLIARLGWSPGAAVRPHVGIGLEMVSIKETFTYRILSRETTRHPASTVGFGPVIVAGVDRAEFPRLRFEAFGSYVPVHRVVASGPDVYETGGRLNAGSFGARVLWRIP